MDILLEAAKEVEAREQHDRIERELREKRIKSRRETEIKSILPKLDISDENLLQTVSKIEQKLVKPLPEDKEVLKELIKSYCEAELKKDKDKYPIWKSVVQNIKDNIKLRF